jgi:hypothetical protein
MFKIENDVLLITLPEGKTQEEIVKEAAEEIITIEKEFYGKEIKINGRITTALALFLGHKLAHISKSVNIFDPKLNTYVLAVWH